MKDLLALKGSTALKIVRLLSESGFLYFFFNVSNSLKGICGQVNEVTARSCSGFSSQHLGLQGIAQVLLCSQ